MSDSNQEKLEKELHEIETNPLVEGNGIHICSDGTEVNIRTTSRNVRTKVMHLEPEEQDEILDMHREYCSLRASRTILRRKVGGEALFKKNTHWSKCLERSAELLDLFGKMYSGQEVHKIVTTEWDLYNVSYDNILKFQRENLETINQMKEEYQKNTSNVRLVHKRSRLDELTVLYQSRKTRYQATSSKSDYELMLKTLEQIRKEVEGQRLTINGQIKVEHEMAVQDHVNQEILKNLNVNDLIVSRLCARLGVSPKYILYRLHTSYYSKFTGFLPDKMRDDNEVQYPSQVVYDFQRIKEMNDNVETEDIEYKEEKEIENPEKVSLLKKKLLEKLKKKQDSLREQKTRANNTDGKL